MCTNLDNFIGVRGCDETAPGSGLYINDYPGITTIQAAHVADSEDIQGIALLQACIERAYKAVMTDVINGVNKFGHFWSGQEVTYGSKSKITDTLYAANKYTEIEILVAGPYEKIRTDKILIHSTAIGTATITVTGVTATVTVHNLVVGLNTITFSNTFSADTTIRVLTSVPVYGYLNGNECSCICGGPSNNFALFVTQYCDLCEVAYQYRESLAKAFQVRAAIEYFRECEVSPNMSQEARKAADNAKKSLIRLLGGNDPQTGLYFPSEYTKELKPVINQFRYEIERGRIPCFVCEQNKIVYQHP